MPKYARDYVRQRELGMARPYYRKHVRNMYVRALKNKAFNYLTKFQRRAEEVEAFRPDRLNYDYITRYYANKYFALAKDIKRWEESE